MTSSCHIGVMGQIIDGTVLTNRNNRQKRPTGSYLRAKCGQNYNQVATGLIVWNQPTLFSTSAGAATFGNRQAHTKRPLARRVPGAGRGRYGPELRSQDLSSSRIRGIKAVELGGIRRPETAREQVAPGQLLLVHLRGSTCHDGDSSRTLQDSNLRLPL